MTEPTWGLELFGVKFVVDTVDFVIVTFDKFSVDMLGNAETSLEVGGVDYQVPSGKTLRLLGVSESSSEAAAIVLTQTDTADSQVGTIDKWTSPFSSTTIDTGTGPTTIFDATFAATKFLTAHNTSGSVRVFTVVGLVGLEFTA